MGDRNPPARSARPSTRRAALQWLCAGLAALAMLPAWASETWVVGPRPPQMSLQEALSRAGDGDLIALMEGEYDGAVGVITQKRLTLRGVGKRPVLRAGGRSAEGKAMLVVRDGEVTLENLEFRGARVPTGNGAGVRLEKGRLQVRRCAFFDHETGLITGHAEDAELLIADSEFGEAPRSTGGLPHLLHVGRIARLTISGSRFHQGWEGHLIKSRARVNDIRYNLIFDGWQGAASYEIDLPNGGLTWLVGNIIGQGPGASNRALVAYGSDGQAWPGSALYMSHNTLLGGGSWPVRYVRIFEDRLPPGTPLFMVNNVATGLGFLETLMPGTLKGNVRTLGRWLRAPAMLDFALPDDSPLRRQAADVSQVGGQDLRPMAEFTLPVGTRPLPAGASTAPGALQ